MDKMSKADICMNLEAARLQTVKVGRRLQEARHFAELGQASKSRDALSEALNEFDQLRIACSEAGVVHDQVYDELERRSNAGQ